MHYSSCFIDKIIDDGKVSEQGQVHQGTGDRKQGAR